MATLKDGRVLFVAKVTHDYLFDQFGDDNDTGREFYLTPEGYTGPTETLKLKAYDDDGELYYDMDLEYPLEDVGPLRYSDYACPAEHLLIMLGSYAGVTSIRFPDRPKLDCG